MMAQYSKKHREWDLFLPELQYAYNTSIHEATEYSPAYLNFGRIPRQPLTLLEKNNSEATVAKLSLAENEKSTTINNKPISQPSTSTSVNTEEKPNSDPASTSSSPTGKKIEQSRKSWVALKYKC